MGKIFDEPKTARPLTIQDYISILTDNDQNLDSELTHMINSLPARYKRLSSNNNNYSSQLTNATDMSGKRTKRDVHLLLSFSCLLFR